MGLYILCYHELYTIKLIYANLLFRLPHKRCGKGKQIKMNQTRGQGQDCRDIGGCIIQISYRQDTVNGRYIATGTRPCMRCMNNVRVVVND